MTDTMAERQPKTRISYELNTGDNIPKALRIAAANLSITAREYQLLALYTTTNQSRLKNAIKVELANDFNNLLHLFSS